MSFLGKPPHPYFPYCLSMPEECPALCMAAQQICRSFLTPYTRRPTPQTIQLSCHYLHLTISLQHKTLNIKATLHLACLSWGVDRVFTVALAQFPQHSFNVQRAKCKILNHMFSLQNTDSSYSGGT